MLDFFYYSQRTLTQAHLGGATQLISLKKWILCFAALVGEKSFIRIGKNFERLVTCNETISWLLRASERLCDKSE